MMSGKISTIKIKNKELQNKLNLFLHQYFDFFILIIVIILLFFGYEYIIKPKSERVNINSEIMITDKQSDKRVLEGALEKLISYRLAYGSISQTEKDKISMILPGKEGRDNLFTNMEAFVSRQGLMLDSIEIGAKDESAANSRQRQADEEIGTAAGEGGINTINLSMEISGVNSYERFKDFLIALENNLRLVDVTSVNYDQEAGSLSLEAMAYYINSNEE